MKKLLVILMVAITSSVSAVVPQKMTYQAVVRNSSNELVSNSNIGAQVSILQGAATGPSVYVERHFPSTNANGLINIEIGSGTLISGGFSSIDWSTGIYFIKTEIDLNRGANYTITATSQLLSVPFALYAHKAGNTFSGNFGDLINKPTSLLGYGITDAVNTNDDQTIAGTKAFTSRPVFNNGIRMGDGTTLNSGNLGKWIFADSTNYTNHNVSIPYGSINVGSFIRLVDYNANSHINTYIQNNPNPIIYSRYWYGGYGHLIFQGNTGYQSSIQFVTGSTPTQRMVVMGNGHVGIGTSYPMRTLHVKSVIRLEPIDTVPQLPAKGDIYFDNLSNKLKLFDGKSWTTNVDGSETKIAAGTKISVTGKGTTENPYIINGTPNLTIGQKYQGGIIFWLDETGQHGLIAATSDQGTSVKWNNTSTYKYTGASGDGIYSGENNNTMIVASQIIDDPTGNFAAKLCADFTVNDNGILYGDWYLPSISELKLLYSKKDIVGGFTTNLYWSSIEYSDKHAWFLSFTNGAQLGNEKGATYGVRAIRSF